ncbi:MAG: NTP/NDP exchange transporter [Nitrospiraceae bacterium]
MNRRIWKHSPTHDLYIAGLLFSFFFLVIAVFQILKPLKSGLFVEHYGAQVELYAKLATVLLAGMAVGIFTGLYNRLSRRCFLSVLSGAFAVAFLGLAFLLQDDERSLPIWTLYFLGDLEVTVMATAFWAYLTDLARGPDAQRFFGPIGAGGVLGGWAGSALAKLLLSSVGTQGLLVIAAGLMGGVLLATAVTESLVLRSSIFKPVPLLHTVPNDQERALGRMPDMIEGARLVVRSPYLVSIAGIMGCYEIASQLVDYQFKLTAQGMSGVRATQAFLTDIYLYSNLLSVFAQLFLVGMMMKRFGPRVTLLALPVAITAGSLGFLAMPTLAAVSLLVILDNGLNYSIQQTGRESLYVATSADEKYKARAFISIFVQRGAKGLSILAVLALGSVGLSAQYLSLITIGAMVVMVVLSLKASRRFGEAVNKSTMVPRTKHVSAAGRSESNHVLAASA